MRRISGQLLLRGDVLEHSLVGGLDGLQSDHVVQAVRPGVDGVQQVLHGDALPVVARRTWRSKISLGTKTLKSQDVAVAVNERTEPKTNTAKQMSPPTGMLLAAER